MKQKINTSTTTFRMREHPTVAKLSELSSTETPASESRREPADVSHLIRAYHKQALDQARAQFWFSIAAASLGFTLIMWVGMNTRADGFMTATKLFAGGVIDAVAYLFFQQATATRERATELYDRLRQDSQLAEAVALASTICDQRFSSAVKGQIALQMSGLQPHPIDVNTLVFEIDSVGRGRK